MKKLILLFAISALSFSTNAQSNIQWPAAKATAVSVAVTGTTAITINNSMNYVASIPTLTANATISVSVNSSLKPGAILLVAVKTTSTETTTFAGKIVAPVVTGVAGKTWTQGFIYNGTNFYPMGAKIQID